jgi:hypothetical protein
MLMNVHLDVEVKCLIYMTKGPYYLRYFEIPFIFINTFKVTLSNLLIIVSFLAADSFELAKDTNQVSHRNERFRICLFTEFQGDSWDH